MGGSNGSILNSIGRWTVHPELLILGAILVAAPLLIHLLNRRRFQVVDWAAMDFLLEADKKNRRRVRLENLLLLLLRCLAVFLAGLFVSRPFLSGASGLMAPKGELERIVVLDDSFSMRARSNNVSLFQQSKERIADWITRLAAEPTPNSLTILSSTNPSLRVVTATPITKPTLPSLLSKLDRLECTYMADDFHEVVAELERYLQTRPSDQDRAVYFLTDGRESTWNLNAKGAALSGDPEPIASRLGRLTKLASEVSVVALGPDKPSNVAITSLSSEGNLSWSRSALFRAEIANFGEQETQSVRMQIRSGETAPLQVEVDSIPPGKRRTVEFPFVFNARIERNDESEEIAETRSLRVEISMADGANVDQLMEDNVRHASFTLSDGIRVLLIDGDPNPEYGKSETFFLERALAPSKTRRSGVIVKKIVEAELDSIDLSKFQVIFACNLARCADNTLTSMKKWIFEGGGLVWALGDQTDREWFNAHFANLPEMALSPFRIEEISEELDPASYATLDTPEANHPAMSAFSGVGNPLLDRVKFFRWFRCQPTTVRQAKSIASFGADAAIAEAVHGAGRFVLLTTPLDADWSNWTSDPSYLLAMQEWTRYLARSQEDTLNLRVGESILAPVDISKTTLESELTSPSGERSRIQATRIKDSGDKWSFSSPRTTFPGVYQLQLRSRDAGESAPIHFAVHSDSTESDLRVVDRTKFKQELGREGVKVSFGEEGASLSAGRQEELSRLILIGLFFILASEFLFAWFIGRGR